MLTRWNDLGVVNLDPGFVALNGLRHEMDRLFQRFETEWPDEGTGYGYAALESNQPQLHVRDTGEEFMITADVPGFKSEDLNVSFEQSSLVIRGERRDAAPEGYSVHRQERGGAVRFARALTLPARVEPDKIEATLRDGVLSLRLPKAPEERPRTISVKSA